jgi:hypothetical protein
VESKLGPLGTSATEWPIEPVPGDYDDGEFGGMKIGRGNWSTRRKLCPPQISLDQTRARTRVAAVGSQRLTAWAMARPNQAIAAVWDMRSNSMIGYFILNFKKLWIRICTLQDKFINKLSNFVVVAINIRVLYWVLEKKVRISSGTHTV